MRIDIELTGEELLDCLNNKKLPSCLEQELRKAEIRLLEKDVKK